jgi:hypothetical protein
LTGGSGLDTASYDSRKSKLRCQGKIVEALHLSILDAEVELRAIVVAALTENLVGREYFTGRTCSSALLIFTQE